MGNFPDLPGFRPGAFFPEFGFFPTLFLVGVIPLVLGLLCQYQIGRGIVGWILILMMDFFFFWIYQPAKFVLHDDPMHLYVFAIPIFKGLCIGMFRNRLAILNAPAGAGHYAVFDDFEFFERHVMKNKIKRSLQEPS